MRHSPVPLTAFSVEADNMLDWDKVRVFRIVAKSKSVLQAASTLGLHQSVVSRRISSLENDLATKLFHRHARGIILTEQGNILLEAAEKMAQQMNSAHSRLNDFKDTAKGELRITTTLGFGTLWLGPKLPVFFATNPDINIHLLLDEITLDLPMREADVAIRMKEPSQADLIRRKLMTTRMGMFVSTQYASAHKLPETLEELINHRLISQNYTSLVSPAASEYIREIFSYNSSSLMIVNNYFGVYQSILNDLGVGILPNYVLEEVDDIVPVIPKTLSNEIPIYLAYSYELRDSKKILAFRDFVLSEIRLKSRKNVVGNR